MGEGSRQIWQRQTWIKRLQEGDPTARNELRTISASSYGRRSDPFLPRGIGETERGGKPRGDADLFQMATQNLVLSQREESTP
jgi:hypothetical protein